MKLKCQKYCENSKEMSFFSDVLCVSRPCVLNAFLAKAKKTNYLTNTPKSENAVSISIVKPTIVHKVHSMIGQRKEYLWKCLPFYLSFTGIPVTIYSTIELSGSVIVLGFTL